MVWRAGKREVIEVIPKGSTEISPIIEEIAHQDEEVEIFQEDERGSIISKVHLCQVERILEECIEELGILVINPVMFARGWQYHRIVVLHHDHINKVFSKFEEACFVPWMLRKVPFRGFSESQMTIATETLFADLTEKQVNAVLTAYAYGYFKRPRDADVQTIADKIGLSRTTFQEHLKKGENKIMKAIIPHIHTWHHFSGSNVTHPVLREFHQQEEIS
jgi:predicted DNA binding protein